MSRVLTFRGMCDASACCQSIGNNRFIVANDEDNVLRIDDLSQPNSFPVYEIDVSSRLGIGVDDETDLEAAAALNGINYWLTSHGRNKNGKLREARYWFFAGSVQGGSGEGGTAIAFSSSPYHEIVQDMLEDEQLEPIRSVLESATRLDEEEVEELAPKKEGLNIEAMAPFLTGSGFYIGLRNPTFGGRAILVPLTNPEQVIHAGAKADFDPPVLLDLGGLAFRSMEAIHVGGQSFYLIVAGPKGSGEALNRLARWSGNPADQVSFIENLPLSPEAISYDVVRNELILTGDDGTRVIGGRPCKELDAARRVFRVMILDRDDASLPGLEFLLAQNPINWMSLLAGGTKLSQLNIPGTHDTCALRGGIFAECQTLALKEQLEAGVRFIDIRCRHVGDGTTGHEVFAIHHEMFYQQLNFDDVLDVCIDFLRTNPTECIIMSIKEEYTPYYVNRSFEDTFDSYKEDTKAFWYLGNAIPTLDSVRGKIVLFRRYAGSEGIDASSWPDNDTFTRGALVIQDEYNVPTNSEFGAKWEKIERLLGRAETGSNNDWYINFLSGSGPIVVAPLDVARYTRPRLYGYLAAKQAGPSRLGTLLMDFAQVNDPLISQIIRLNG